jgi:hypothetical protein
MEFYRETYKNSIRLFGGKPKKSDHVVVYGEQGNGDIIMMLRYIPLLLEKCGKVTLHVPPSLFRLVKSQWDVEVLDKASTDLPPHDYHIASMDLPFLFKVESKPYITITEKVPEIEGYLWPIGIAWEGSPMHSNNRARCCPLKYFRDLPGSLFSLQKEVFAADFCVDCEDIGLLSTEIEDFYDVAKLINSVDYVVTVDTAILHLSGAMGKLTYGLLSVPGDPRWGEEGNSTCWYPTVTLLRQASPGDWPSVFKQLDASYSLT